MKKNVFISVVVMVIVTFTGSLFTFAGESKKGLETRREIVLKGRMGNGLMSPILVTKNTISRSINLVTAFVEEGLVTIRFNQSIEDDEVSILIRDETGDIIFENSIIIDQAMEVPILIDTENLSGYTLEVYSSTISIEGEF